MTLTDKLDLLLKERGLNRKEFSRQSGIPYMTIVNFYEKGTENVKLSTLKKIANFFDVSLDYIADDSVSEKSTYQKDLFAGDPTDDTEKLIHKTFQTMDVKTKLSELLEEKGMKQADLSHITGIPTSLISNYLKGVKSPSLSNAVALASALNVTVDELAGLSNEDASPSSKGKGFIGERIKKLRKNSGLSVKEVVLLLQKKGISVSDKTVYSWESGYRQPDAETFLILCDIYQITDLDAEFGKTEKPPESLSADSGDKEEKIFICLKKLFTDLDIDVSSLTERQKVVLQLLAELIVQNF